MSSYGNAEELPCLQQWSDLYGYPSAKRDVASAAPACSQDNSRIWDFITFLAVAQEVGVDFIPITWLRSYAIGVARSIGGIGTDSSRRSR